MSLPSRRQVQGDLAVPIPCLHHTRGCLGSTGSDPHYLYKPCDLKRKGNVMLQGVTTILALSIYVLFCYLFCISSVFLDNVKHPVRGREFCSYFFITPHPACTLSIFSPVCLAGVEGYKPQCCRGAAGKL